MKTDNNRVVWVVEEDKHGYFNWRPIAVAITREVARSLVKGCLYKYPRLRLRKYRVRNDKDILGKDILGISDYYSTLENVH